MNYKILLLPVLLFFSHIGIFSQNRMEAEEVLVITTIESLSYVINFEYNDKGFVTSEIKVDDNEYLSYKFEYEYDENGNMTMLTKTDINFTSREENEYNDNNQIIIKKIYQNYGFGFKFVEQKLYTYQEEQLETIICQMVSADGQNFFNNIKQNFYYNKQNFLVQINQYAWVVDDWIDMEIFGFEYDNSEQLLYYSSELYLDDLCKNWRYHFHYNDDNELIERAFHFPVHLEWDPIPVRKIVYHYESLSENENVLYPNVYQFDELNFNYFQPDKKLIKNDYWNSSCGNPLHFEESASYLYETIILNHDTIPTDTLQIANFYESDDILVYPNPTTGELTMNNEQLTIKNIEIFNVCGRKVFEQKSEGRNQNKIDISALKTGVYFLKIKTLQGVITKKVIKH